MKIKEYVNSKKEAERVRRQLVKLVKSEKTDTDAFELPNSEERGLIKYYYYIHQGIDIVDITPIESSWVANILSRIPPKLKLKTKLMEASLSQVRVSSMLWKVGTLVRLL